MKVINKQMSNNIMMANMPAITPEDIVVAIGSENDIDSGNNFQPAKQSPRIEDNILK